MSANEVAEPLSAAPSNSEKDIEAVERPEQPVVEDKPKDPNLVTWDGPDDQANPRNWSFKKRWLATGLVSLLTFMTPLASSMIAPSALAIENDLHFHSSFISVLIFSIFLLAFVVGPFFLAPMSEIYGRVHVMQVANIFFLIFNLACGFAQNESEMLAFRFLSGLGACAPQTVGGGVLSDLWRNEERGMAVALYTLAPIISPSLGPLIGAWVTEKSTWRWSFWSVTIFGVCVQVLLAFTLKETYPPRLLQLKAEKLRKETGNDKLRTEYEMKGSRDWKSIWKTALTRPFILLFTQPIIIFLAVYMSMLYGTIYLMLATFPTLWRDYYHESIGIGGLNYLSLMIGMSAGGQFSGHMLDRIYKRLSLSAPDGKGRPEFRVPILFISTFFVAGGLLMYGWTAQARVHWIAPNIGTAIFGFGAVCTFTGLWNYVIDAYTVYAASAIATTAAARSLTGFGFPLFAGPMYEALHWGWGNTVIALAALVIGYAGSLTLWFFGERLRRRSTFAADQYE